MANTIGPYVGEKFKCFKKLDLNDNRISEATCEHVSSIFSVGENDRIEIVLDEQDEESDYETDGDDIDLESISKIVAEIYSPRSSPQSSTPAASMTNLQSSSEPLREKIVSYYKNIDSSKLGTIDVLLEKYKGREDELLLDIQKKYSIPNQTSDQIQNNQRNRPRIVQSLCTEDSTKEDRVPLGVAANFDINDTKNLRTQLINYFSMHDPEKKVSVDILLEKFYGNEPKLVNLLKKKHTLNMDKRTSLLPLREQLIAFFTKFNPEKVETVDILLEKNNRSTDELMRKLKSKYKVTYHKKPQPAKKTILTSLRQQLVSFFTQFNQEKLETVDILLEKNIMSEEELMQKLKSKYGVSKSAVRHEKPTTCVFSDKVGIFDLGKTNEDETVSLEEIHNRISRMRVADDLDIGIINLCGKSLDPDAMEVLADMLSRMDNIHTAQLRNMTHGRDPAVGEGAKSCEILISAMESKHLRSIDISSNMLGASAGKVWGPLLNAHPEVEALLLEADHKFRHGYKADACNDLLENFLPAEFAKAYCVKSCRSR